MLDRRAFLAAVSALTLFPSSLLALASEIEKGLQTRRFIYISSTRKDGSLSKPAEMWFFYHQGVIWVASSPDSWRARRIRWGRPRAKIWVGKTDGPAFMANGEFVRSPEVEQLLMKNYAEKYPGSWDRWEKRFQEGFKNGERVLIKYTPIEEPAPASK